VGKKMTGPIFTKRIRGKELQRLRDYWFMSNPLCASCFSKGIPKLAQELDHIVPLHKGGTNKEENLQGLCRECHAEKTRIDLGWKERVSIGVDGWPVEVDAGGRKKV
jgi:5-methylcytosine-specific restriction protein A